MKLAWVRGFVAVADAGGFAEAAEQLFTTQSTVSKQIQSLEKELGVTLFDRTGRRAALSPAGRALLPHARRLLREEQALRAAAAQQGEGGSASLRIASIPIAAGCGFTAIAASFARANPHIRLTLDERETGALSAALDGGYDFAVARRETLDGAGLSSLPLFTEALVAVLPPSHPLADQAVLPLAALSQERFLLLTRETGVPDFCAQQCEKAGFSPNIACMGTHMAVLCDMVAEGLGVTLAWPRTMGLTSRQDVRFVPLAEHIPSTIALMWRRDRRLTPAAQAFLTHAAQAVRT